MKFANRVRVFVVAVAEMAAGGVAASTGHPLTAALALVACLAWGGLWFLAETEPAR